MIRAFLIRAENLFSKKYLSKSLIESIDDTPWYKTPSFYKGAVMGILSKFFAGIIAVAFFAGCDVKVSPDIKVKTPNVKINFDDILSEMRACNKPDSELSLDKVNSQDTITIIDKIDSMDIESIDCKGNKTKSHGPVRQYNQLHYVEAPASLTGKVSYVIVENQRTCTTQLLKAGDDALLGEQIIEVPDLEPIKVSGPATPKAGTSGRLALFLADMDLKMPSLYMSVRDGNNVLKISYYGECLKKKPVVDTAKSESANCLEPQLLLETYVKVDVQIERQSVPGTRTKDVCYK